MALYPIDTGTMNDISINQRMQRCFQAVFPNLAEPEIAMASVDTVSEWDSVAMITLMTVIEEEFHVTLDFEELETLRSFEAIVAALQARLGTGNA